MKISSNLKSIFLYLFLIFYSLNSICTDVNIDHLIEDLKNKHYLIEDLRHKNYTQGRAAVEVLSHLFINQESIPPEVIELLAEALERPLNLNSDTTLLDFTLRDRVLDFIRKLNLNDKRFVQAYIKYSSHVVNKKSYGQYYYYYMTFESALRNVALSMDIENKALIEEIRKHYFDREQLKSLRSEYLKNPPSNVREEVLRLNQLLAIGHDNELFKSLLEVIKKLHKKSDIFYFFALELHRTKDPAVAVFLKEMLKSPEKYHTKELRSVLDNLLRFRNHKETKNSIKFPNLTDTERKVFDQRLKIISKIKL